jgi:pimeloyl-ACP methyl ester carboxylesterase
MYYEVHGSPRDDVPPLLVLHGALATVDMFGDLVPQLARNRQVIAAELQGHGRTADVDRPLRYEQMADDVAALLDALGTDIVDVFGFSMGGGVAWQLAVRHPERVRKLVSGSASPIRAHAHDMAAANPAATFSPEIFAGTPIETEYQRVAPHPQAFPALVRKVADLTMTAEEIPAEVVEAIAAPTMVIAGDADIIRAEGAADLFRLRGGGAPGDFAGMSPARLAILPGTTHMTAPMRTAWLRPMIEEFLDAPVQAGRMAPDSPVDLIGAGHEAGR